MRLDRLTVGRQSGPLCSVVNGLQNPRLALRAEIMWINVYLVPYRSAQPVLEWVEENSVKEYGNQRVEETNWHKSASAWPRWQRNNASPITDLLHPVEVFLCLEEEIGIGDKYDITFLVNLLGHARTATWGANIYIVLAKGDMQRELFDAQHLREEWFEILLANNVTDILEITRDSYGEKLRNASALSRRRRKILSSLASGKQWRCHVFQPAMYRIGVHKRFLLPFLANDLGSEGSGCVLVLTAPISSEHIKFIKEALENYPDRHFLAVTVDEDPNESNDSLYSDLQIACRDKCELLSCRGLFELHYLLQQLNASPQRYSLLSWSEQIVQRTEIGSDGKPELPGLLITHAFIADADFEYCYAAAAEVNRITENLSDLSEIEIALYPAISTDILPDLLQVLHSDQLIWLHIGHGEIQNGIQQSRSEIFKTPEDWLRCFAAFDGRLVMVSFSVCESKAAASYFAISEIGTSRKKPSASIGFGKRVPIKATRFLTERVIPTAIRTVGDAHAIRKAFAQGRELLEKEYQDTFPEFFEPGV